MRSVLHTTPHAYWQLLPTFPARSDSDLAAHRHVPEKGVRWAPLSTYALFDLSCCWTKIAPPVPTCNSPFTHGSCVMSTICLMNKKPWEGVIYVTKDWTTTSDTPHQGEKMYRTKLHHSVTSFKDQEPLTLDHGASVNFNRGGTGIWCCNQPKKSHNGTARREYQHQSCCGRSSSDITTVHHTLGANE